MKTLVSILDPALDMEHMDLRAYAETRDESLIRDLPGRHAARFRVRRLSVPESQVCDSMPSLVYKLRHAILFALESVDVGGGAVLVPTGTRTEGTAKKRQWRDNEYDNLVKRFGKAMVTEIAQVIAESDEMLGEAFGDSEEPRFTLSPLSQDGLARRERRHAELMQRRAETQNSDG